MTSVTVESPTTTAEGKRQRRRSRPLESRLAVWVVEALYVCLLGFLVGKLVWTIFTPLGTPVVMPSVSAAGATTDLSVLRNANAFGSVVAAPVQESYANAEETRLDLKLVGTFVTGEAPSATIQAENGRQRLYFVGDEVARDTTIRDVLPDRVILSRAGITETLSLDGREGMPAIVPAAPARSSSQSAAPRAPSNSLLSQFVQVSPNPNGAGFVVAPGTNPSVFAAAGLQRGDIVVAANGRPLPTDITQAQGFLIREAGRGPVALTINRSGVMMDVTLDPTRLSP